MRSTIDRRSGSTNRHMLTAKQVQGLRSACETVSPKGKRDLAILDCMLFQGLQLKEVANLRLVQIRGFGDQLTLNVQSRVFAIKIHDQLHQSLQAWMDQRDISLAYSSGPVFVPIAKYFEKAHKPLGSRTISRLVAKYGNRAGLTLKRHGKAETQ